MSKSKKFLAMCLALMLVISVVSPAAVAAGTVSRPNTTLSVGECELPEEGTAVLPIMISGNEGFIAINISLTFDHELFTVVSVKRGSFAKRGSVIANIDSFNEGRSETLNINMYNASGNLYSDGCVFEVTLQAKEGVTTGAYPVRITYDPNNTYYARDLDDINNGTEPCIIGMKLESGNISVVHSWDEGVPTPSSCIEGTYDTLYTCTVCGATKIEPGADAHPWELVNSVEPTCTENGMKQYACSKCGKVRSETVPALGHDFSGWEYADSETHVHKCQRCGHEEKEVHEFSAATTAAGCTDDGYITYTCTDCGYSYTTPGESATGHQFGGWEEYDDDQHVRYCENCGEAEYQAHTYGNAVTVEATCEEGGHTKQTCTVCGHDKKTYTSEPLGHDYGQWEPYDDDQHVHHCDRCDTDAYEPHTYSDVIVVDPTCTEGGYTQCTCEKCGADVIKDYTDPLGHDYVAVEVVEPTEETEGYTMYRCSRCGDEYNDDFTGPVNPTPPEPVVLKGDVDDNGVVNNADIVLLARYLVALEDAMPRMDNADMDDNEFIDNQDIVILARKLVNL